MQVWCKDTEAGGIHILTVVSEAVKGRVVDGIRVMGLLMGAFVLCCFGKLLGLALLA